MLRTPFSRLRATVFAAVAASIPTIGAAATFDLQEASIADLQAALAAGATSSVELTTLYLNRIHVYDRNGIRLNAIPVLNPTVLEEAAQSDRLRAAGTVLGPLHGVPYTIKDSYKAKGLTVAAGSPAFAHLIANEDAFTVGRVRAAGGVLIGKTNMPPLANGGMQRGVHGRAESPYNADFLTAAWGSGSSNGSGTSTAANFAMFSLGEETVSSGRSPSSNNALVAYTPSRGVISLRGNWPLFPVKDVVVPMTRSVPDLLAVLNVIVADDPDTRGDFWRFQQAVPLPAPSTVRPTDYATLAKPDALRGKRFGVPTLYLGKDRSGQPITVRPSILALWEKAAADLRKLGATVVEVEFPLIHDYEEDVPGRPGYVERGMIPDGWWSQTGYAPRPAGALNYETQVNQFGWEDFLQANGDPSLGSWKQVDPEQVFPVQPGSVDDRRRRAAGGQSRAGTYLATVEAAKAGIPHPSTLPRFAEALQGLENIRKQDFEQWMRDQGVDAMVMPANADVGRAEADVDEAAFDHAQTLGVARSNTNRMLRHLGIPSVSVSMGLLPDIGMPVNLTFFGAAYTDDALLSYAYAYEHATHNRRPPPRTPALDGETIAYDASKVIAPEKRRETVPPSIALSADDGRVVAEGSDASGLSALRVYVDGRKVAERARRPWRVRLDPGQLREFAPSGAKKAEVLVFAKDRLGNAAATTTTVALGD